MDLFWLSCSYCFQLSILICRNDRFARIQLLACRDVYLLNVFWVSPMCLDKDGSSRQFFLVRSQEWGKLMWSIFLLQDQMMHGGVAWVVWNQELEFLTLVECRSPGSFNLPPCPLFGWNLPFLICMLKYHPLYHKVGFIVLCIPAQLESSMSYPALSLLGPSGLLFSQHQTTSLTLI